MPKKDMKLAQELRDFIKKWDDYWRFNRTQYHEWMDFVMGDMWKEDESKVFTRYNKIPLTFNKLAPLAYFLLGEQRQNTPNLQICPGKMVPEQTAEIRDALIKNITFESDAELAYQTAFFCAVVGGFGAYSLGTEYEDPMSFDQKIRVYEERDPTRCYWDVSANHPTKVDGMGCGRRTRISRPKFRGMYGRRIEQDIPSSSYTEDTSLMSFNDDDSITIIDHYKRKYDSITVYKLSDGRTVEQKDIDKMTRIEIDDKEILFDNGEAVEIIDEKEDFRYKIIHYKMAGDWLLEKNEFPAQDCPIIFVDQCSYFDKNGKQICRPFFKDCKDAQRYLNYLGTQSAYIIKVSRYDQFMASKANVKSEDTQAMWRDPATQQAALVYDESPNGNKPERLDPPELSQSLMQQYERTLRDIETSTGIYGTQVGQKGNEVSGAAVDARTRQGSTATYVVYNSLNRAIAMGGKIIDQMIPVIYDTERTLMLKMSDQMTKPITINREMDVYGSQIENDMTKGSYQIRLLPGPSYEGQKQQALESLQTVLQANPQIFNMVADLYAENLPVDNNIELRNRLRTLVPHDILEAGKSGKPLPPKQEGPPPEVALKMQEMELKKQDLMQRMKEQEAKAQADIAELNLKQQELKTKIDHDNQRVQMEWQKLEAEKLEAAAKLQEQEMRFQAEMARINTDADIAHAENISKLLIHAGDIHRPERTLNKGS